MMTYRTTLLALLTLALTFLGCAPEGVDESTRDAIHHCPEAFFNEYATQVRWDSSTGRCSHVCLDNTIDCRGVCDMLAGGFTPEGDCGTCGNVCSSTQRCETVTGPRNRVTRDCR